MARLLAVNRKLRVAIVASGQKQKDVARRADMDQWRLSRIIHRDIEPTPQEQKRLARVLRLPVEQLFDTTTPSTDASLQ